VRVAPRARPPPAEAHSAVATIPPGTPHGWRTKGEAELHVTVRLEPPRSFEDFARDLAALAERGAMGSDGAPPLLQLAVVGRTYPDKTFPASPAIWVQKTMVTVLSMVARLLGHRAGRVDAAQVARFDVGPAVRSFGGGDPLASGRRRPIRISYGASPR
jgi:hypothetical protein